MAGWILALAFLLVIGRDSKNPGEWWPLALAVCVCVIMAAWLYALSQGWQP
jgi:hypothetical protein